VLLDLLICFLFCHKIDEIVMVSLPKLTLTYFNFGGRAEPLRLAAAIGKVCRNDVYPPKDL
jgi:hypothetical protein